MAGHSEGRAAPRGQLRIYLGAAAGVGKTFAMLGEGHRRGERGADVVVAFAEPHSRPQTAALLDGLEVIPRKQVTYRGATFEEMDVDAVLARKPQIALVDELAHTNVPGSRNEKRWQDINELLDAGIDVISAVNIQHLESLNDVVEQITGVPQRETIPDAVVRAADQVELVDQRDLRLAGEHRVGVHLLERAAAVRQLLARDDLESVEQRRGLRPRVRLSERDDHVRPALAAAVTLTKHGVRLPHTRGCAQVNPQLPAWRGAAIKLSGHTSNSAAT